MTRDNGDDRSSRGVVSDDVWRPDRIVAHPDGAAAFVVAATAAGDEDRAGIWYGPLSGVPVAVTGEVPVTNLALHADGTRLAYALRDDSGPGVLVVRRLDSGRVRRYPIDGYPEFVAWSGDDQLLVLVAEPGADSSSLSSGKPLVTSPGAAGSEPGAAGPVGSGSGSGEGWRRVWRLDTGDGRVRVISPAGLTVWEFCRLDQDRVVAVCGPDPTESGWYHPTLAILGPDSADRVDLHVSDWQLSCPTVRPDGTRVAYLEGWSSDRGLHTGEIRVRELGTGAVVPVELVGVDPTWIRWGDRDRLWFAGWSGLGTAWGWLDASRPDADPWPVTSWHEDAGCLNARWHPEVVPMGGDRALTVRSTPTRPPEVTVLSGGAAAVPWTALNGHIPADRGLTVAELRWPDPDGGPPIEGLLVLPTRPAAATFPPTRPAAGFPPTRAAAGAFPLVVNVHGGPTVAYHHSWELGWAELLTGAGYAVLLPNQCGGAGRGQAFGRRNLGDPAGAEYQQILAGVEHCVARGYADGGRVAAIGASYGGYLAGWALARGDVGCAVVIAGISELRGCRAAANNPAFYDFLCAGDPELFVARSPVSRIDRGSRPALILHGELDRCVPVGQADALHAGLRAAGVATELVIYPGEGHQTQAIGHLRDQRARVLGWLSAHLPGG